MTARRQARDRLDDAGDAEHERLEAWTAVTQMPSGRLIAVQAQRHQRQLEVPRGRRARARVVRSRAGGGRAHLLELAERGGEERPYVVRRRPRDQLGGRADLFETSILQDGVRSPTRRLDHVVGHEDGVSAKRRAIARNDCCRRSRVGDRGPRTARRGGGRGDARRGRATPRVAAVHRRATTASARETTRIELDERQQLVDARRDAVVRPAEEAGSDRDVLADGEMREEADLLEA
jgi:hypothetical protein